MAATRQDGLIHDPRGVQRRLAAPDRPVAAGSVTPPPSPSAPGRPALASRSPAAHAGRGLSWLVPFWVSCFGLREGARLCANDVTVNADYHSGYAAGDVYELTADANVVRYGHAPAR